MRVAGSRGWVWVLGLRVLGIWVQGPALRVQVVFEIWVYGWLMVSNIGVLIRCLGFRISDFGFQLYGSVFWVDLAGRGSSHDRGHLEVIGRLEVGLVPDQRVHQRLRAWFPY